MTAHDHSEVVNGCFRCELGRDELGVSGPQLDIDAIEARAEGAIDGPWELHEMAKDESYGYWPIGYVTDHPNAGLVCEVPDYGYWTAVFIAAARTDVPVLCAEVRQLRQALAAVEKLASDWQAANTKNGPHHLATPPRFCMCLGCCLAAALGAAVTPTPQEQQTGTMSHCCFAGCTNVVCRHCGKTYCVNFPMHDCRPTPEAATERCICGCRTTPSGLQRATEQQQ